MLHFFPPGMAQRYFLFGFLAALGTIQLIAARSGWFGLALLGRQQRPWGYLLGSILLASAYLWFFGTSQALIFRPGLAGSELFSVFGGAVAVAVGLTLGLVSLLHRGRHRAEARGELLRADAGGGIVQWPRGEGGRPAVVLITDLPCGRFPIGPLADALVAQGITVVITELEADGAVSYPEVVARVPSLVQTLQLDPRLDGDRIALVGVGLGGDLALRAAATDPSIVAVVAIDPILDPHATGLDQLRRLTWWEALRWGRARERLTQVLEGIDLSSRLANRPALIVQTGLPNHQSAIGIETAAVTAEVEAVMHTASWLVRHLVPGAKGGDPRTGGGRCPLMRLCFG